MALFPLALSVGIVAAVLMLLAAKFSIVVPVVFIACSIFFVAGGRSSTLIKGAIPSLSGLLLVYGTVDALLFVGGSTIALALLVGIIAFLMVFAMNLKILTLGSGAFLGCAAYFADRKIGLKDYR